MKDPWSLPTAFFILMVPVVIPVLVVWMFADAALWLWRAFKKNRQIGVA